MRNTVLLSTLVALLFSNCEKDPAPPGADVPTIYTRSPVINITYTSASIEGEVTSAGNSVITARGICWSTQQMPTISDSKTNNMGGTGSFTNTITGLLPNTTYYVRAYASNSTGTNYGGQINFTTLRLPTITTNNITSITANSAVSGGFISNAGTSSVTQRGVCWSTSTNPTIALGTKTFNGSGTGSFTSNIVGLASQTTYYVRAYATNAGGTSYGANISFRTN